VYAPPLTLVLFLADLAASGTNDATCITYDTRVSVQESREEIIVDLKEMVGLARVVVWWPDGMFLTWKGQAMNLLKCFYRKSKSKVRNRIFGFILVLWFGFGSSFPLVERRAASKDYLL
jgi:hypothetical protein